MQIEQVLLIIVILMFLVIVGLLLFFLSRDRQDVYRLILERNQSKSFKPKSRPRSRDEIKIKIDELKSDPEVRITNDFSSIKESDIPYLDLDELYRYAAAEISRYEDFALEDMMMFGGLNPAHDLAAPLKVLAQYDKWVERLYRAERGLPVLDEKIEAQTESIGSESKRELVLLIEELARLKEAGHITEEEYLQKKADILNRL